MSNYTHRRWAPLIVIAFLLASVFLLALPASADHKDSHDPGGSTVFITFCHAAGLEGTTQFVTLTLPEQAVFGQAGHFNEDGTPQAGHEADYLGECEEETVPDDTTTTTVPDETTTTQPPTDTPEQPTTTTTALPFDVVPPTTEVPTTEAPAPPPITELPFTGVNVGMLAMSAAALATLGGALLRRKG